ncbi:copper transporter [Rubrobacter indicoceani]|uniref:copper transporter n=1 Tax=Rubrobacter indicoceani TaxID=2051957 RepID=UPI000E5B7A66|nr:copper transporter [Rubrobacter indicoceani]
MPDLRYHLISLISVFLALAIGILLGVAVADQGVVTDSLEGQITEVQERFSEQQEAIAVRDRQIERLQERTVVNERLMVGMSEAINAGTLTGLEVAVVSGPYSDGETVSGVLEALDLAGAEVTAVEELPSPTLPGEVTSASETTTPLQGDYLDLAEAVATEPGDASVPPQIVIFVGGGEIPANAPSGTLDALNEAEAEVFDLWNDYGIRVVGAEPTSPGRSEIALFQSAGLPSVDNADTPAGLAAVITLANSDQDGSYGTKDTASDPFPTPE